MPDAEPEFPTKCFKLIVEYDGSSYGGWQRQPNTPTIQKVVEDVLSQICREKVVIHGSGRTDAGVHAYGQVAHFHAATRMTPDQMAPALNSLLPRDISILSASEVGPEFHARKSAISKTYRYVLLVRSTRPALMRQRCYHVRRPLDVDLMRKAAARFVGRHDFRAFSCRVPEKKSCVRAVNFVDIKEEGEYIFVEIQANGFLQRMVRTIVGTLVEVGVHRFEPGDIDGMIASGKRSDAGPSAPARGLFLVRVHYGSAGD